MTDKVQKIREAVVEIVNSTNPFIPDEDGKNSNYEAGKLDAATKILQIMDSLEEPVSKFLNTESMIESYKQRLISQANGMKNSPLIDMCLVSYKHGINETLDTLNLSNVQRTGKDWKEPQVKESAKTQHANKTCKESDNSLTQEDTVTIRKEWFEYCKESWYNEEYIDGKYNRDRQFKEPVSEELEKAAVQAFKQIVDSDKNNFLEIFKAGAKWKLNEIRNKYGKNRN